MSQISDFFKPETFFSRDNLFLQSAEKTHRLVFETLDKTARLQLSLAEDLLDLIRPSEFDNLQKPPSALGGAVSMSPYIIVDDADRHYARAVATGAEIVIEIRDEDYGGRGYSCRDPEGHVWSFGSYDPWASA